MTVGRAGRDSLLSGGSALAGLAAGFGTVVLVAHTRGAETAGVMFGAIGLFTILSTVCKLGTETTFVYYAGHQRGSTGVERHALVGLLRRGLVPVVAASIAVAVLVAALADPMAQVLIDDANRDSYRTFLLVLAPFVPIWALTLPLLGITRGLGDLVPTAVGLQIVQPLLQLALVSAALATGLGAEALAAAWALPLVATLLVAVHRVATAVRDAPVDPTVAAAAPPAREFWGHATPRGLAGTLSMAVDRLGVVLVGSLGSAAMAGAWTAITRLLGICLRVVHAMSQALNARLPALLGAGRTAAALGQARLATWWTIALLTPVLIVAAIFPGAALGLFEMDDMPGASGALQVAVGAAAVIVVLAHTDNVLLMSGRSGLVLLDGIPSLLALIGLTALLLPDHGLVGAAVAWVVSATIYRVLALVQVRCLHGRWILTPQIVRDAISLAVVCLGIAAGVRVLVGDGLIAACAAGTIVLTAAGAAMLVVSRRNRGPADQVGGAATESAPAPLRRFRVVEPARV